jgi:hypothetical protein
MQGPGQGSLARGLLPGGLVRVLISGPRPEGTFGFHCIPELAALLPKRDSCESYGVLSSVQFQPRESCDLTGGVSVGSLGTTE